MLWLFLGNFWDALHQPCIAHLFTLVVGQIVIFDQFIMKQR